MRKIYSILILTLLIISCSSDNGSDSEQNQDPTVSSISSSTGNIGDEITINGQNFNPNANYIIQFNGVNGVITEITTTTIKVQIPSGATSGNIILVYNGVSTVIGNITINLSKLYGYKYFGAPSGNSSEQKQIVEIDKSNGTSQLVATLNVNSTYFENLVFDSSVNKIIGLYDVDDSNVSQSLLIVDLNNGNSQTVDLDNVSENSRYSGLIIGNNSKLYGYKYFGAPSGNSSEQKQIVEIDKSNGTSQLVATLNVNSTYFENLVFDSSVNKIIGLYDVDDSNVSQSLLIVDLNNGNSQTVDLDNVSENSRYSGLIIGNNSKLYGYKYFGAPSGNSSEQKQIVEIDKSNGTSQLVATLNVNSTYFENLVFDSSVNKIIGLYDVDDSNVSQSLLIVDLNNGNSQTVDLDNVSENSRYSGLINE